MAKAHSVALSTYVIGFMHQSSVCFYTYTQTYVYACIFIHMYKHAYTHIYIYIYTYSEACTRVDIGRDMGAGIKETHAQT